MRITVIGKQFPDSLAHNLGFTLCQMGHDVVTVDEDTAVGMSWLRNRSRRIHGVVQGHPRLERLRGERVARQVSASRPDMVLNTFAEWEPETVDAARTLVGRSVPFVFLYPDPSANLGREYPLVAPYDILFFKDPQTVDLFRTRLGLNAHYLPEACNPAWHRPVEPNPSDRTRYGCDLATAGNMYYYRARMLEPFAAYDLKIWGSSYPAWLRSPLQRHYPNIYVAQEEKAKAFRAAKIVINTLTHKDISGANARAFEAAGCGAFQIADWRPAMEELFEPDREIVLFRSRQELKEKVDYYLAHPEERRTIADAGHRRAYAEHTYRHRLDRLMSLVWGRT